MRQHSLINKRSVLKRSMKKALYGVFAEYETPKMVIIHSLTFAILLRVLQIMLLIYSVLYLLLYEKGYQKQDTAIISSVTLKVKGIGYIKTPQNHSFVIDVADYIIPPSENNAIFLMTNFIDTDQIRAECPESPSVREAVCRYDSECQNKPYMPNVNGRWTGRCLLPNATNSIKEIRVGQCEIEGWCPAENDRSPSMMVNEILNFTIFIKNFIEFPAFDVKHKNMVDDLKPCIFHPTEQLDCPIFRIEYILNKAEPDAKERALILRFGGVVRVKLEWDCNLDRSIKKCKPEYSFARLDVPFRDKPFSVGFNFRYASHWKQKAENYRTLTKAYGLRLIIAVNGKAGKFDFLTLTLNIGSVVGVFGLATFLCDIFLLQLSSKARVYRKHVFESVHLNERSTSIAKKSKHISEQCLNSDASDKETISLYGTPESVSRSSGNTVAIRPLTLMSPDRFKHSKPI